MAGITKVKVGDVLCKSYKALTKIIGLSANREMTFTIENITSDGVEGKLKKNGDIWRRKISIQSLYSWKIKALL